MRWLVDGVYLLVVLLTLPIWLVRMIRTGKIRTDWRGRFGHVPDAAWRDRRDRRRVLIHAVSVGEVNAIRELVAALDAGGCEVVVATTTDTGTARAEALFGSRHQVVRFPFDLSWMMFRFLSRIEPDSVVLVELEVWPNLVAACARLGVPVLVINGRLTSRSHRRYAMVKPLVRRMFSRLAWVGVQDEDYAARFRDLGAAPGRIEVVGNMKWDNARCSEGVDGSERLALELGIDPDRPLIVAGSTAPGEHELLLRCLPDGCQLLCAPRKPEWFDEAAQVLEGCTRRSAGVRGSNPDLFLLDTIGELAQAYDLADVAVIGRSFIGLHGSDPTQSIALGVATVMGPDFGDFRLMVEALADGDGLQVVEASELSGLLSKLILDEARRRELGRNGRAVIVRHQGATAAYAHRILA
ncbi:MAG: glycosyltransferase N-terminal domain-containing protein [Planctomycetota bacterium]|nr:glycosyltransferase N-terminal domain-containing protein [Planctomycetota bacterium]